MVWRGICHSNSKCINSTTMKKIFHTIIEALHDGEVKNYAADEENGIVDFYVEGTKATYHVHLYADEKQELLLCWTLFPFKVPIDRIPDICTILNRINDTNIVTALVVAPEDGMLQCRFPCTVDDGAVNKKIVAAAICNTITCFEQNYNEIVKGTTG